jgi:hypothetical protein
MSLHIKKVHRMRGFKADFVTIKEVLKMQTEFIAQNLAKAICTPANGKA